MTLEITSLPANGIRLKAPLSATIVQRKGTFVARVQDKWLGTEGRGPTPEEACNDLANGLADQYLLLIGEAPENLNPSSRVILQRCRAIIEVTS